MTIQLTSDEFFYDQLRESSEELQDALDKLDVMRKFNTQLSQGWRRKFVLREGLSLFVNCYQPKDYLKLVYLPGQECDLIKFSFALSANGQWKIKSDFSETLLPCTTGSYLIRSNGSTLHTIGDFSNALSYEFIEIFIKPSLLFSFGASGLERINDFLKNIVKASDKETYCLQTRPTQPSMMVVLQQILQCPYKGIIKRAYLESKAIELIALVLEHERVIKEGEVRPNILKPDQKERIYYAREILLKDLHSPPSLTALAQRVGLSESVLGKGFRQIFGTTIFAQLQVHRLGLAKQLLAEQDNSIAEVAHLVGYSSVTSFSKAFKRKFGMAPKVYQKSCG